MAPYNEALVAPLARLLPNLTTPIKTRKIGDSDRMKLPSGLLPTLTWDEFTPLICGPDGFIASILDRKSSQRFVFLYLYEKDRNLKRAIHQRGQELGLTQVQWIDSFLFFATFHLALPFARSIDKSTLPVPRLRFQTCSDGTSVDYEGLVDCYGTMAAFEVQEKSKAEHEFIDFLLMRANTFSVFSPKQNYLLELEHSLPDGTFHLETIPNRVLYPVKSLLTQDVDLYTARPNTLVKEICCLKIRADSVITNRAGGLIFEFTKQGETDQEFVAISLARVAEADKDLLIDYLLDFGLNNQATDIDLICALCYLVNDAAQLSYEYKHFHQLPIFVDGTQSPGLYNAQVPEVYEPILVFEREKESVASLWQIAANMAVKFKIFRSPWVPITIVQHAGDLLALDRFDCHENVYLSLTGAHWKHVFLEIYRVLERLYYFGWMHRLKHSLGISISEFSLFQNCNIDLKWKGTELDSIMNLLAVVPKTALGSLDITRITSIELKIDSTDDHSSVMRKFGSMIYAVRNSCVHLGDLNIKPVNVTSEGWPMLVEAMYRIVLYLYREHSSGMPSSTS